MNATHNVKGNVKGNVNLEALKLEGEKLEGERLEGEKLEGEKLEGEKIEGEKQQDPLSETDPEKLALAIFVAGADRTIAYVCTVKPADNTRKATMQAIVKVERVIKASAANAKIGTAKAGDEHTVIKVRAQAHIRSMALASAETAMEDGESIGAFVARHTKIVASTTSQATREDSAAWARMGAYALQGVTGCNGSDARAYARGAGNVAKGHGQIITVDNKIATRAAK